MRAILTYHSIDTSGSPISCHPDTFTQHVKWLASGRVRVTSIAELAQLPQTADAVAVTFDDGFENFGSVAAPQLLKHGIPVTLFVVSDLVGTTNAWDAGPGRRTPELPLLDWQGLATLHEQGVGLGAHSVSHQRLPGLSAEAMAHELSGSADRIEERCGTRPSTLAYPYGDWNAEVVQAASQVFRWACTTEFGLLPASPDPLTLPRLDMYYFQHPNSLEAWGTTRFRASLMLRNRLRWAKAAISSTRSRRP